jgi:hypothetical protein
LFSAYFHITAKFNELQRLPQTDFASLAALFSLLLSPFPAFLEAKELKCSLSTHPHETAREAQGGWLRLGVCVCAGENRDKSFRISALSSSLVLSGGGSTSTTTGETSEVERKVGESWRKRH